MNELIAIIDKVASVIGKRQKKFIFRLNSYAVPRS